MREKRSSSFHWLAALFGLFVLFLYGPMITIFILSFQGPEGGLTFPMNGISLHWFAKLWEGLGVVDIWAAFRRSFRLGLVVMVLTVVLSLAAGFAYRKRFRGADVLFYVVVASLIVPSIVVSLGIGLEFRLIDDAVKSAAEAFGWTYVAEHYTTAMGIYTSGLGAQLTWTLPFGLLITFAIFNRFDHRLEEAARDLGATPRQSFAHVVLPIIAPSVIRVHAVVGRCCAIQPGDGRSQHAAARARGADHDGDEPANLRARHRHDRRILRRHLRGARVDPGSAEAVDPYLRSRSPG
jgi:putative spermidine/putrescine transport system permease protein